MDAFQARTRPPTHCHAQPCCRAKGGTSSTWDLHPSLFQAEHTWRLDSAGKDSVSAWAKAIILLYPRLWEGLTEIKFRAAIAPGGGAP